jgi:uncharacterized delta-60 repeat protein
MFRSSTLAFLSLLTAACGAAVDPEPAESGSAALFGTSSGSVYLRVDTSFGSQGRTLERAGIAANAVASAPNHGVLLAGTARDGSGNLCLALERLAPDGTHDSTFGAGTSGAIAACSANSEGRAVAVQPDGEVLMAGHALVNGTHSYVVNRFTSSGAPDLTFGTWGTVSRTFNGFAWAEALALQPDGKILVAGTASASAGGYFPGLTRYQSNGALDTGFGWLGAAPEDSAHLAARAIALQPDGKILVAGTIFNFDRTRTAAVERYLPTGWIDTTFGTNGVVRVPYSYNGLGLSTAEFRSIAIGADGGIVLVGQGEQLHPSTTYRFGIAARLTPGGVLDKGFNKVGTRLVDLGSQRGRLASVIGLADDSFVAVGDQADAAGNYQIAAVHVLRDGTLQSDFGGTSAVMLASAMPAASGAPITSAAVDLSDTQRPLLDIAGYATGSMFAARFSFYSPR